METNPFRAQREGGAGARGAPGPPAPGPGGPRAWVERRVVGQDWRLRAPILLVLFWVYRGYPGDPLHTSIFDGISLGFHEVGHAVFMLTGNRFLTVAGGTLFELGVPVAAGLYLLLRQRDPFGATVCAFWLGTALWHTAAYAGDARAQLLPLVSPFGPVDVDSHDWTYMLMRVGRLSQDREIAASLRTAARIAMVGSLLAGAWVVWVMARARGSGEEGGGESPAGGAAG